MIRSILAGAILLCVFPGLVAAQEMEMPQPTDKHAFLKKFEGEWTCETEARMTPDSEPMKSTGTMTGELFGGFFVVVDVMGDMGGMEYHGRGTFGFDTNSDQYVGSWIDNCTGHMWKYEGNVEGNKLVLNSEGPNMMEGGKMTRFRDSWTFESDDVVVLRGEMEGPDGQYFELMKCTCRRKAPAAGNGR